MGAELLCLDECRLGNVANRIGDGALPVAGRVQVDESGPGAAMAHAFHQLPKVRARVRRQRVPGVSEIVEVHADQADRADRGQPCATVDVAVTHRRSGRTGEDERVVLLPHELAEVLRHFGAEQRGERYDALSSAGFGRAEGVAAAELLYQLIE